jgi:hypothetical protein
LRYLPHSCFLEDREGRVFIPQIHVWQNKRHLFSDDVIFGNVKKSPFQVIVPVDTMEEAHRVEKEMSSAGIEELSGGPFLSSETTYIIHREGGVDNMSNNFVFAMSQSEYDKMGLQPPLKGYDKERIRKEFP